MKREYDFRNAKRGAVVSVSKRKTRITIRLDEEILAWFRSQANRAGGGSYQTLINEALRQHIQKTAEGVPSYRDPALLVRGEGISVVKA